MQIAPLPANEADRVAALRSCKILDSVAERGFDEIVDLAAGIFRVPMALVSLVDADRQWFKAKVGVPACQTGRDEAFCSHVVADPRLLVVDDACADPRFHDNPLVVGPPYVRFYAGAPLTTMQGLTLGTLCILDVKPRTLTTEERHTLCLLARQVIDQIDLRNAAHETRTLQRRLIDHQTQLEDKVRQRTRELHESREEIVRCLARAAEFRDDDTGHHIRRVCLYVRELCAELGMSDERCETISLAATLHDVGKIGIPDAILLKPGRLSAEEFDVMRKHAVYGSEIVQRIDENNSDPLAPEAHNADTAEKTIGHCEAAQRILGESRYELLQVASRIALTHHEKFDGSGYPAGLHGQDIPIEGRIVAVADVFDALTSRRPYKPSLTIEKSCQILREGSGSHFDPQVVDAFFTRFDQMLEIHRRWQEPDPSSQIGRVA